MRRRIKVDDWVANRELRRHGIWLLGRAVSAESREHSIKVNFAPNAEWAVANYCLVRMSFAGPVVDE
jgi:hypothetical protein